ncbi:class I SAM-dependent methyltransferase [Prochlorococcus sp. MIT 0916]|uniref:class I SAM-dependent methyltransferase n=1 Tax=Prochlorococcus sp. MIT 0916 TaxID=3082521 RepID=UPI0039B3C8E4
MENLKLNLGCGERKIPGYINVDKFGNPDIKHNLESFPWPWETDSVSQILLIHVLEHLGKDVETYFRIFQEMYRICNHGAKIRIIVPHFRHNFFYDDPTHVRVVTPLGLELFSKKANKEWARLGQSNSPLGLYLDIDFELKETAIRPSSDWFRLHPEKNVDIKLLQQEANIYNNLIEQYDMLLEVIK